MPLADTTGYKNVKKQIVIGPEDGSKEIVIRYFSLEPGGNSPRHTHDFPHLVQVERGAGVVIDADGQDHPLSKGGLCLCPRHGIAFIQKYWSRTF